MRGDPWEDLLSCSLEWTNLELSRCFCELPGFRKERWMSRPGDCWAWAGEVSNVIDELTQRPPALWVKLVHPHHENQHTDLRKLHDGKKGEESRNRRFVK